MRGARCAVLLALAAVLLFPRATVAQDCRGHGTPQPDGTCLCTSPVPSNGTSGWVGAQCEQEVKPLPVNGVNTSYCLQNGTTMCWAATLWGATDPQHYFVASVTLSEKSPGGLKLYGLLAADPTLTPGGGPLPIIYPKTAPGVGTWDYLVQVSPDGNLHSVLQVDRQAVAAVVQQGIYLCASNPPGEPLASFTLRAAGHSCPVTLHDNGFISICSSTPEDVRYVLPVCPAGVCSCTGIYSRPAVPVDPGLGFESCSAPVVPLDAELDSDHPLTVSVANQPPGTWHFFNLTVLEEHKHLAVVVSATAPTASPVAVFVRPTQPPGRMAPAYAARTNWSDFTGDLAEGLMLGAGIPGPNVTHGVWYAGVYTSGFGEDAFSYTLTVRRSACAGLEVDCAGRGTCSAGDGVCTCTTDGAGGVDCSYGHHTLALGVPVTSEPRTFLEDTLQVPGLTGALYLPTVKLQVRASFIVKTPLPAWVTLRPVLLLSPYNGAAKVKKEHLTPDTAPFVLRLPEEPDKDEALLLDAGQLGNASALDMVFWNPISSPYKVGYTVTAELITHCIDNCTGHGECITGRCVCDDGWLGTTCSVDIAAYTNGTGVPGCTPGSRMPRRKEDERATCWLPCDPDTTKYEEDKCVDFTCDPTAVDGHPQRRAGGKDECVVDLCGPAGSNVTVMDVSGEFVCDRACVCPEDGSVCALDAPCLPNTQHCLNGLVLETVPDGTTKCVMPPTAPLCEEGSLRLAIPLDGGAVYAICVCSSSPLVAEAAAAALWAWWQREATTAVGTWQQQRWKLPWGLDASRSRMLLGAGGGRGTGTAAGAGTAGAAVGAGSSGTLGDGTACAWTLPSAADIDAAGGSVPPDKGVVMCVGGYQVTGASELPLSDGRKIIAGGKCSHISTPRRGVSGGMVFFWCLFSVALAGTLVVGIRRALEWYEARRWDTGDSGGGGFVHYAKLGMESLFSRRGGQSSDTW